MMMTTQENLQPGESELFDVFLSYARADKEVICRLKAALRHAGLSVWMDERIEEFEGVSDTILKGISRSKIFLAWYSKTYITRPACQWELISALTADPTGSDGAFERILVVNPHRDFEHIEPITLRDKHTELAAHANSDTFSQLAERIRLHAARFHDSMGPLPLFQACTAWPARSLASTRTFVGYVPELLRVHGSLWANNHPIASNQYLPGTVQLVGLPGSGKSLLAEEYAARFAGCYPGGIYWLQLSEMLESEAGPHPEDSLEQRRSELLHSLATTLMGWADYSHVISNSNAIVAQELLALKKPYLWIVDDFPAHATPDDLRKWIAPSTNGRTIFTSRSSHLGSMSRECIALQGLPPTPAKQLLTRDASPANSAEDKAATEICVTLAYHPLALAVASGSLRARQGAMAYRSYLADLNTKISKALEIGHKLAGILPNGYAKNIVAALMMSVVRLTTQAREILLFAVHFARAPIPKRVFIRFLVQHQRIDWMEARDRLDIALAELERSILLRSHGGMRPSVEIHGLTASVLLHTEPLSAISRTVNDSLATVLVRQFALAPLPFVREELQELVPHALHAVLAQSRMADILAAYLGQYYALRVTNEPAFKYFGRAFRSRERLDHNSRFQTMIVRGYLTQLALANHISEAAPLASELFRKELQQARGDRVKTLASVANYVDTLVDAGHMEEAERIASTELRKYGDVDHAGTRRRLAKLQASIAEMCLSTGRCVEAYMSAQRALFHISGVLFEGHPERSKLLILMARARRGFGAADQLFPGVVERALQALREVASIWGWAHPFAVEIGMLIADALHDEGKPEDALKVRWSILKKCLDAGATDGALEPLRMKLKEEEVPNDEALAALASSLDMLTDFPSAEEIDATISMRAAEYLGDNNLVSALDLGNQALHAAKRAFDEGDYDFAIEILVEAAKYYHRTHGVEHKSTLFVKRELGNALSLARDHKWAWALHEELLEYYLQRDGGQSTSTLEAAQTLIDTLRRAGEPERAFTLEQKYFA